MKPVVFFFELGSPYSYIAASQIEDLACRTGCTVDWSPIDISVIWSKLGVLAEYSAVRRVKRSYIAHDAARCAADAGVPLAVPVTPASETAFAKLAYWGLRETMPERAHAFIKLVWRAHFSESRPIGSADQLAAVVSDLLLGPDDIAAAARSDAARRAQDLSNATAFSHGCFGIPWFVVGEESFFGHDRLAQVESCLERMASKPNSRQAVTASRA